MGRLECVPGEVSFELGNSALKFVESTNHPLRLHSPAVREALAVSQGRPVRFPDWARNRNHGVVR